MGSDIDFDGMPQEGYHCHQDKASGKQVGVQCRVSSAEQVHDFQSVVLLLLLILLFCGYGERLCKAEVGLDMRRYVVLATMVGTVESIALASTGNR